jgi:hypothetical protein
MRQTPGWARIAESVRNAVPEGVATGRPYRQQPGKATWAHMVMDEAGRYPVVQAQGMSYGMLVGFCAMCREAYPNRTQYTKNEKSGRVYGPGYANKEEAA